jgi:hypothetical protein
VPKEKGRGRKKQRRKTLMRKLALWGVLALMVMALAAVPALAQSGHFVGTPTCTDEGTTLECDAKVAGLGGTTFQLDIAAPGSTAIVECENPAGNVAPGQDTTVTATGTSGPLETPRNGSFTFRNVATNVPTVPNTPTCPNRRWTANVVDVEFGDATLTLLEDGIVSDTIIVPVT